jgi:hypothetical protein
VAESLKRQWLATEPDADYIATSLGRFPSIAAAEAAAAP